MPGIPQQPPRTTWLRTPSRLASASVAFAALAACASVSLDEPLENTPWRLVQLDGQQVMFGADPNVEPRIQFHAGSQRVSGNGGCNSLSGGYKLGGGKSLRIGPLASTRMACIDAGRSTLEGRFLAALQATAGYTVKGGQLTLLDGRSMPLAVLDIGLRSAPPP